MGSFYERVNKKSTLVDDREDAISRQTIDKWIFRLLLVLLGFMPLVVLANIEEVVSPLVSNISVLTSGVKGELFTHYKAFIVIIITVITGLMLLAKIIFMNGTIHKTWVNYILGAFVVAIVLSTIFSPNITIALNGQYNRSDGAISWLCYVALMFIAMNIEYPKKVVNYVMYAMMPFVYINLYIITMNFYGKDLLQQAWLQKFVSMTLPEGANLGEGSQLVGTLNQWNYMSGMFAMMTVMYIAFAITSKKWADVVVGAVTAGAAIAVMWMSLSTSGFLTVAVLSVVLLVALFKVEHKKQAFTALAIFVVISAGSFHVLANKNEHVWNESFGYVIKKNPYAQPIETTFNFTNKAYASDASLQLPVLPDWGVSAGTGRAYIWGKGLDLVKERPLLGYGGDSFMYNFPHYNIDARAGIRSEHTITDKPHNTYVGVLYGFGVIAFIAILVLLVKVGSTLIISVFKKSWAIFVVSMTATAYFAQSMFNDSLPGTSAIAFVLIGIVIALTLTEKEGTLEHGRNN